MLDDRALELIIHFTAFELEVLAPLAGVEG